MDCGVILLSSISGCNGQSAQVAIMVLPATRHSPRARGEGWGPIVRLLGPQVFLEASGKSAGRDLAFGHAAGTRPQRRVACAWVIFVQACSDPWSRQCRFADHPTVPMTPIHSLVDRKSTRL